MATTATGFDRTIDTPPQKWYSKSMTKEGRVFITGLSLRSVRSLGRFVSVVVILFLSFPFVQPAYGQREGEDFILQNDLRLGAMNDTFRSLRYAPALQAWRPSFGVAAELYQNGDFSIRNADFYLHTDFFSYSLSVAGDGSVQHGPTMSFTLGDNVGIGVHADFDSADIAQTDLRFQVAARLLRHLSLSAQYQFIDVSDHRISASVAVRPFTGTWNNRLTFGIGNAYNVTRSRSAALPIVELPVINLSTEIVDGVLLDAGYSFEMRTGFVTIGVAHDGLTTGTSARYNTRPTATQPAFDGLAYWVEYSNQERKSYSNNPPRHTVRFTSWDVREETRIASDSPLVSFEYQQGLLDVLATIDEVCRDPRVTAVLFDDPDIHLSYTQLDELVHAFQQCKDREKPVIFYSDNYSFSEYVLAASIADEIIIHPEGYVDIHGLAFYRLYIKDLLDTLGIDVQVYRSHAYKNGLDDLQRDAMSPEEREAADALLANASQHLKQSLARRMGSLSDDELDALIADGPYALAQSAQERGLVDTLLLPHEIDEYLFASGTYPSPTDYKKYESLEWNDINSVDVALINVAGFIKTGESIRGRAVGSDGFRSALRRAVDDNSVRAIVLRIDSPGGSAIDARSMAEAVYDARGTKPIVAWVGTAAASGGYYIAAAADHIIASPVSLTGSIGVLASRPDISGLLSKIDTNYDGVQTTDNALFSTILTPPADAEQEFYRAKIEQLYELFVTDVARYRGMEREDVEQHARGRIWSGQDAHERGLIDQLGFRPEVISYVQEALDDARDVIFTVYDHGSATFFENLRTVALARFGVLDLVDLLTVNGLSLKSLLQESEQTLLYYDPLAEYKIR